VSGAAVVVLNTDTNTATRLATMRPAITKRVSLWRQLPGCGRVAGFKKSVRGGIVLPVGVRLEINPLLQLGDVTDTVSVTAEAPILETSTASWAATWTTAASWTCR